MHPIGILTGPTATGKTDIALKLARAHGTGQGGIEIINADSLLVYRGLDIGTAKPTREERANPPHHLIDIVDPETRYDAGDFVRDANAAIDEIHQRGKRALIVGGTGFYLKALLFGMWESPPTSPELRAELEKIPSPELYRELFERDEKSALRIGVNDRYRLVRAIEILRQSGKTPSELQAEMPSTADPRFRLWIIDREDEVLHSRIERRTQAMIQTGLVDEVRAIRARAPKASGLTSIGYAQVCDYLDQRKPPGRKFRPGIPGLLAEIELATRQLVKKQRTWLRSFAKTAGGLHFMLDEELSRLEAEFNRVYGKTG